jgi:hypothetical protein
MLAEFEEFARIERGKLQLIVPRTGIDAMLRFYRDVPITTAIGSVYQHDEGDLIVDDVGDDILRFEWGIYDWGEGPGFHLEIARTWTEVFGGPDGDQLNEEKELSFVFRYALSPQTIGFGSGREKCESAIALVALQRFIAESAPFVALRDSLPNQVFLDWGSP